MTTFARRPENNVGYLITQNWFVRFTRVTSNVTVIGVRFGYSDVQLSDDAFSYTLLSYAYRRRGRISKRPSFSIVRVLPLFRISDTSEVISNRSFSSDRSIFPDNFRDIAIQRRRRRPLPIRFRVFDDVGQSKTFRPTLPVPKFAHVNAKFGFRST